MTPADARTKLLARRAEIAANLDVIADQLDDPVPKDWEDAASERQGDEVLTGLAASDAAELKRIDLALARIEDGSWGECAECGEPIAARRLEALPDTPLCITCAEKAA